MNLIGKTFNRSIGGSVTVASVDGDVAILENQQRVNIDTLMNTGEFTESIDMTLYTGGLKKGTGLATSSIINSARGIPDNVLENIDSQNQQGTSVKQIGVVETHKSAQGDNYERASNSSDDPRKVEELRQKAITLYKESEEAVQRQTNSINQYLDDGDKVSFVSKNNDEFVPGSQVNIDGTIDDKQRISQTPDSNLINNDYQNNHNQNNHNQNSQYIRKVDNPMTVMFKGFTRVPEFKCMLEINEMIPNLEMMRMFEDSYDLSIIDHFTDEILNKVSNDPNLLRSEIKKSLEVAIYGKSKSIEKKKPKPKSDIRGYKKSKNKDGFLKSLKNKGEVIALGLSLKVNITKTAKRGDIEKQILGND
jgi:hypothetical protein